MGRYVETTENVFQDILFTLYTVTISHSVVFFNTYYKMGMIITDKWNHGTIKIVVHDIII